MSDSSDDEKLIQQDVHGDDSQDDDNKGPSKAPDAGKSKRRLQKGGSINKKKNPEQDQVKKPLKVVEEQEDPDDAGKVNSADLEYDAEDDKAEDEDADHDIVDEDVQP